MDKRIARAAKVIEVARKARGLSQADLAELASEPEGEAERQAELLRLGQQVRARRKHLKLSQVILAQRARVQQSEISRLERGVSNITMTVFFRILDVLDCELGFFDATGKRMQAG